MKKPPPLLPRLTLCALALFLGACAHNPYAAGQLHGRYRGYEHYQPTLVQMARMQRGSDGRWIDNPQADYRLNDRLVLQHADHMVAILRSKLTGSRFARYTSGTAQVGMAAMAGASSAVGLGARTAGRLAFGSALMPELGSLFNSRARAESYQQAVHMIETAQADYYDEMGSPSSDQFTRNGRTLHRRVLATINMVEKAVVGLLPTPAEMDDATARTGTRIGRGDFAGSRLNGGDNRVETFVATAERKRPSGPRRSPSALAPDARRDALLKSMARLKTEDVPEVLKELRQPAPADPQEARNDLGLHIAHADERELAQAETAMREQFVTREALQKQRERAVPLARKLAKGQSGIVLGKLGKPAPADDRQARTSLKVLISVSDEAQIGRIEQEIAAAFRAPQPGPDEALAMPTDAEAEQSLKEHLIKEHAKLSHDGANQVLAGIGRPPQSDAIQAKVKVKVAIANASGATLTKLQTLIEQALALP